MVVGGWWEVGGEEMGVGVEEVGGGGGVEVRGGVGGGKWGWRMMVSER